VFLRLILIIVLIFLVAQMIRRIFLPSQNDPKVKGSSPRRNGRIDENRIQDANFKDLPK